MVDLEKMQQDVAETKQTLYELKGMFIDKNRVYKEQPETPVRIGAVESLTGYKKQTIYEYCRLNKIPYHKKNNRLFFFKSEITDWIKQGKQKTIAEIEADTDTFLSNKIKTKK
jgi:predicted DNA-binding transcriptional regulator AlpA